MIRKYTDQYSGLIQTRKEPLRNKMIFTEYLDQNGAIFISNSFIYVNTTFQVYQID